MGSAIHGCLVGDTNPVGKPSQIPATRPLVRPPRQVGDGLMDQRVERTRSGAREVRSERNVPEVGSSC